MWALLAGNALAVSRSLEIIDSLELSEKYRYYDNNSINNF